MKNYLNKSTFKGIKGELVHKMSWNKIEEHCRMMCRFFDWTKALAMK